MGPNSNCRVNRGWKRTAAMICLSVSVLQAACGASSSHNRSEYGEAAVFAGIAMTAGLIQTARSNPKTPVNGTPPSGCCSFCDACSVPCGNSCVGVGTVCLEPRGCACYGTLLPEGDRSPIRPASCQPVTISPDGLEPIYPIGISP